MLLWGGATEAREGSCHARSALSLLWCRILRIESVPEVIIGVITVFFVVFKKWRLRAWVVLKLLFAQLSFIGITFFKCTMCVHLSELHEIQVADRKWEKTEMHILIVNIRHFRPKAFRDLIKFKSRVGSRNQTLVPLYPSSPPLSLSTASSVEN